MLKQPSLYDQGTCAQSVALSFKRIVIDLFRGEPRVNSRPIRLGDRLLTVVDDPDLPMQLVLDAPDYEDVFEVTVKYKTRRPK